MNQSYIDILIELSKHLTPGNENVRRGDVIASIRDLAQVALTNKGLADEAEAAAITLMTILTPAIADAGIVGETWGWSQVIETAKQVVAALEYRQENLITAHARIAAAEQELTRLKKLYDSLDEKLSDAYEEMLEERGYRDDH